MCGTVRGAQRKRDCHFPSFLIKYNACTSPQGSRLGWPCSHPSPAYDCLSVDKCMARDSQLANSIHSLFLVLILFGCIPQLSSMDPRSTQLPRLLPTGPTLIWITSLTYCLLVDSRQAEVPPPVYSETVRKWSLQMV